MTRKKRSVLIVEDDPALNEAYKIILEKAGYNIETAFNGQEALQQLKKKSFEVILLDLRMPVMDGIEFLKEYNASSHSTKGTTKIIVFSNYDMQKEINEAYELGAQRYILKAWATPKQLLKIIDDCLRSTR